jgi:hypothetical protein
MDRKMDVRSKYCMGFAIYNDFGSSKKNVMAQFLDGEDNCKG